MKLTDFGVGKSCRAAAGSRPGPVGRGRVPAARRHFAGKPLTRRSDLYALGGGPVHACSPAGRRSLAASPAEFLHKHCYTLPDRPANFVPKLPPEFDELICDLLAKDPARRPASAAAVLDELDRVRGKLERKGVAVNWPPDPGDATADPGPAAARGRPAGRAAEAPPAR